MNRDFTSKETMTSSLEIECCFICCVKTEQFCTEKVFLLRGDRTETRYLDTAYVGLLILLVMGRNGLPEKGAVLLNDTKTYHFGTREPRRGYTETRIQQNAPIFLLTTS